MDFFLQVHFKGLVHLISRLTYKPVSHPVVIWGRLWEKICELLIDLNTHARIHIPYHGYNAYRYVANNNPYDICINSINTIPFFVSFFKMFSPFTRISSSFFFQFKRYTGSLFGNDFYLPKKGRIYWNSVDRILRDFPKMIYNYDYCEVDRLTDQFSGTYF